MNLLSCQREVTAVVELVVLRARPSLGVDKFGLAAGDDEDPGRGVGDHPQAFSSCWAARPTRPLDGAGQFLGLQSK